MKSHMTELYEIFVFISKNCPHNIIYKILLGRYVLQLDDLM